MTLTCVNVVKYSASKHQQLLPLCSSHALEGQILIIKLSCNYLIAKWSALNSLPCCIIDKTRIKMWKLRGGQAKWVLSPQMATFRCSEWSFFNIYITDILLLSPHVAMWRPLAHLWSWCASDKFRKISEDPEELRYHFTVVIPSYFMGFFNLLMTLVSLIEPSM